MATYNLTSSSPSSVKAGDILNCPYSGSYKSILLPKGTYKLECWGAASLKPSSKPGKGGYATGTLALDTPTTLYLYTGGQPVSTVTNNYMYGGWNGGGASYQRNTSGDSGAGGGASDICLVASSVTLDSNYRYVRTDASYKSRILVAGGAGGGYSTGSANVNYRSGGYCPSQTTSQTGYIGGMKAAGSINSTSNQVIGGFGYGATAKYTGDDHSGGGGGWYGGGSQGDSYGGGGSSFAWSSTYASYAPSGYSVPTSMYLTNVSFIYGNASMTSPTGATETGHAGNGYIRITVISVQNGLDGYYKNNSVWSSAEIYNKQSGSWTKDLTDVPSLYLQFKIPTTSSSFTYDSATKTPAWDNYLSKYMTISGTTSASKAGTYTATFSLKEDTYRWSDGTTAPKSVTWSIAQRILTIPSQSGTLTYNKSSQSPSWSNYSSTYLTLTGTTSGTNKGTYTVTFTIKDTSSCKWSDGTTAAKTVNWTINVLKLTKPTKSGSYTYNGNVQILSFSNFNSTYETKSGDSYGQNAGNYTCYIALNDTSNTQWTDGTTTKQTYTWSIAVKTLNIPTLSKNPEYTGSTVSPTFNNYVSSFMTVSGNSATEIGSYTAVFSLDSTTNTKWSDSTTSNKSVSWQVTKAKLAIPTAADVYYTGSMVTPTWSGYDSTKMTMYGVTSQTYIGEYTVTISLNDTEHYMWSDGTVADKEVKWKIVEKPSIVPYLTFSSPGEFTLSVGTKGWNGTLEYFNDFDLAMTDDNWVTWDGSEITSGLDVDGTGDYCILLRGYGNTKITGGETNNFTLTGSYISCNGNIETLLDYGTVVEGEHPSMIKSCYHSMFAYCTSLISPPELPAMTTVDNCYMYMFRGCTALTSAPELPATSLSGEYCYYAMFHGCTALTSAPELPATELQRYCYNSMFRGCTALTSAPELPAVKATDHGYYSMFSNCTNLITVPKLPATTLASYCYAYMFSNCSKIKLSSTKTGEYTQTYRIPSVGTGDVGSASSPMYSMFYSTGGTFKGAPSINTAYYLSNTNNIV